MIWRLNEKKGGDDVFLITFVWVPFGGRPVAVNAYPVVQADVVCVAVLEITIFTALR